MNRQILSRSITIVILYMLVVSQYAFSQNLISNGSFEQEDESWQTQGDEMERHHQNILGVIPPTGEYYAELGNSKVFYTSLGHGVGAATNRCFQQLLLNALEWLVTDED